MLDVTIMTKTLRLHDLAQSSILAGSVAGKKMLGLMMDAVREPSQPSPLFLDLDGIEIATASYLRESILSFCQLCRIQRSNIYPVISNVADSIVEELSLLVNSTGDVLIVCDLEADGTLRSSKLIGALDAKQRLVFDLVKQIGEVDARTLMQRSTTESVQKTAWNNRLASLASAGLILEITHGRTKRYRPLLVEK